MPREAANELVDFLRSQAGEHLRGAVHYTPDDYYPLYMRADVERRYTEVEMADLFEYWRERNEPRGDAPFSLGDIHCTVQFYDDALLFHFTQGQDVGTVITFDPEAGRDIVTFITRCLEHLHRHSPQSVAEPTWFRERR